MSDTPKIMEGTPEVIYLQTGDAGDEDMTFAELDNVTWAEDWIARDDTKYIRADVVERENADLREQVVDARRSTDYWKAELNAANTENAALRAELEQVRKDAERLDWLTRMVSGSELRRLGVDWPAWSAANSRAAIDAAIAQGKGEK